jgi:hypothetical protein
VVVFESSVGAGVVAYLVFLRPAGTLATFEAATGAGLEADLVFLRLVLILATSEATGAGVDSDLVFLRGAIVSRVLKVVRVLRCVVEESEKLEDEVKRLYVVL